MGSCLRFGVLWLVEAAHLGHVAGLQEAAVHFLGLQKLLFFYSTRLSLGDWVTALICEPNFFPLLLD